MSATVNVRVLPDRALSLTNDDGVTTTLHVAGDELELPADDAERLEEDGFVEVVTAGGARGIDDDVDLD